MHPATKMNNITNALTSALTPAIRLSVASKALAEAMSTPRGLDLGFIAPQVMKVENAFVTALLDDEKALAAAKAAVTASGEKVGTAGKYSITRRGKAYEAALEAVKVAEANLTKTTLEARAAVVRELGVWKAGIALSPRFWDAKAPVSR